jgi:hypothetical protein
MADPIKSPAPAAPNPSETDPVLSVPNKGKRLDGTGLKVEKVNPDSKTVTVSKSGQTFDVSYAVNGPIPKVGDTIDADLIFDAEGTAVKGYFRRKK